MVYVINYNGKPLMPCSNVIASLLLKYKLLPFFVHSFLSPLFGGDFYLTCIIIINKVR
jgi:hypothetical protein